MSLSSVAQLDRLLVEPSATQYKVRGAADSLAARHIVRLLEGRGTEQFAEAENGKRALQLIDSEFFDLVVTYRNTVQMDDKQRSQLIRSHSTRPSSPVTRVTFETDRARLAGVRHSGGWAMFDQSLTAHSLRGALQRLLA